jgi:hypothetical protein
MSTRWYQEMGASMLAGIGIGMGLCWAIDPDHHVAELVGAILLLLLSAAAEPMTLSKEEQHNVRHHR